MAPTGLRAVGFRDRVTTNDQWHLGSITKPMTATLAARLVEKGCINWETTIAQAVPELADAMREECRKITIDPDVDFAVFAACNAAEESGERACDQAAWAVIQRYPRTKTP